MIWFKKPKLNNKRIWLAGALALMLAFSFYINPQAVGQNVDELQKLKQEKQQKLDEINKKISAIQAEIRERKAVANSLKNEIALVNLEIAETEAQIEATEGKIDTTNLEIAEVTETIVRTEAEIKGQKENLKQLIRQINELEEMSPLEIALENDNLTDFIDQLQYASNIQDRTSEILAEIKKLKEELEQKQLDLKKQKATLDALLGQLEVAQNGLRGQRTAKQEILDETRGQEKIYQRLLAEQEGLEEQISKEIYNLEVEIRNKLGNRRLPARKGLLAWPMDGTLTQGYGNTGFTSLGYSFHNGIDLAGPAGTAIYAAADGIVLDTGTGQGAYGNWVTIKHNNIAGNRALITLYAHMSSFKVRAGQAVAQGDLIGFEGNTGNTTRLLYGPHRGYHLHFTVFDTEGYDVAEGQFTKIFGSYRVPYGYTYNPLEFL
ncbi:MAG: peptidoglycan DD-metalloendopeptidase family protein [Candidatus Doudnabacteria bacterium]|nr:peptidoglycan DD-metalloendopeptidase family protein [Candidatus Doudnabacteria bacterium]